MSAATQYISNLQHSIASRLTADCVSRLEGPNEVRLPKRSEGMSDSDTCKTATASEAMPARPEQKQLFITL